MAGFAVGSKEQVNFFKGLAIAAVVAIHAINTGIGRTQSGSGNWIFWVGLDQMFRFSVPVFVALSGFALAKKYSVTNFKCREFYQNRLLKLLPLYFLWTAIYLVSARIVPSFGEFTNSFSLWQVIFEGRGQFHLYFVPMIFQAYLLFPLLFNLVKRFPVLTLAISLALQAVTFRWINSPGWSDQGQYMLFASWQFYFVLGIFLAGASLVKLKWWVPLVFTAGWLWVEITAFAGWNRGDGLIWATRFTRWPVLVYSTAVMVGLTGWGRKIQLPKFAEKTVVILGANSYLIYLSHVLFLQIFTHGKMSWPIMEVAIIGISAYIISLRLKA